MDWIKLDTEIKEFAANRKLVITTTDRSYPEGQLSIHQFADSSETYYEIKHSKPIASRGSKLRIFSLTDQQLSVISKTYWWKKISLKIVGTVPDETHKRIEVLSNQIGSFSWTVEKHTSEWPSQLHGKHVLKFECNSIDLAVNALEQIRSIHQRLS